ncbi:MAG TPA: hypothetical protein VM715_04730 [Candidatus Acidoferrum sp.]|nr:hypothetical protein [Candidatus Acidoferrum sp.]
MARKPSRFRLETRDIRTGALVARLPYKDLQAEFYINKPDNLRCTLPLQSNKVTKKNVDPGAQEIWLWRDGKLRYAGPLWAATADLDAGTLAIESEGLLSYFAEREIKRKQDITDFQDELAWNMVNATQRWYQWGDLRIVRGRFKASGTKQHLVINVWEPQKVLDIVTDDLAKRDFVNQGFDFWIDPATREFNCYYPYKSEPQPHRLVYPKQLRNVTEQINARAMVNDYTGLGSGQDAAKIVSEAQDPASQQRYTLMQDTFNYGPAKTKANLDNIAKANLALKNRPLVTPSLVCDPTQLPFDPFTSIGDQFQLVVPHHWFDYDEAKRFVGFQLTLGPDDNETMVLFINDLREVVDTSAELPT